MNAGSRDTPTEEKAQRLASSEGHIHSKAGGSLAMHDHGRHSPASAHSPGVSGKLPGLHPDSSRSTRGFGTPSFSTTGLPGIHLEHLPFLFNSASSLIFPPFMHPSAAPLFPPVLPPNFLPPSLQPQLTSLFPSPGAECEPVSGAWSAHSGGSRNTSSLGSSSSEGDVGAKIDGRTARSSRCTPDANVPLTSLPSSVRKFWDTPVSDSACISESDMPLSLVTRRETTSRGSSAAESGVCTGDSVARAASTETSRTPSIDGESGCHPVGENSSIQEQTISCVGTDQSVQWPAAKAATDASQLADDGKSSTGDDVWSASAVTSRSSCIALPPRKRLTRNADELHSSATGQSGTSSGAASSPSSAPNFRSCWKKFAAKSNVSGPSTHRSFGGKPQYDCRTYFQKLAEQARAAAASKAFVAGKGKGHLYRNKTSPRNSDQNTGSPRVTRSQSKPKKTQSPKSSPAEPPAPVRKSTRKKSVNSRFEEYERTVGKNKKAKSSSLDSNAAAPEAEKDATHAAGSEGTPTTESSQRKNRRRGKMAKGEPSMDADVSSGLIVEDDDSSSQSQLCSDAQQPAPEADNKQSDTSVISSVPAVTTEGLDSNAKHGAEDASVKLEPSVVITVLPPKFRHFKSKTAAAVYDTSQMQVNSDQPGTSVYEFCNLEVGASAKNDKTDSVATVTEPEGTADEDREGATKPSSSSAAENSVPAESSAAVLADEPKVSQSHSVGGRKSLLYRSSTVADSQPISETQYVTATSLTHSSMPLTVTSSTSGNQTSGDEKSDKGSNGLEGATVSEHDASSAHCVVLSLSSTVEAALAETNEKVEVGPYKLHTEQCIETVPNKSSDVVSCKPVSPARMDTNLKIIDARSVACEPTFDHPSTDAGEKSSNSSKITADTVNADVVPQTLGGCFETPADGLRESDGHTKLYSAEATNVSLVLSSQSVVCMPTTNVSLTAASMSVKSSFSTPVTAVAGTSSSSCRTKPIDAVDDTPTGSVLKNNDSLKRPLPDATLVRDDRKRCRVEAGSVDHLTDGLVANTVTHPVYNTLNSDNTVNLISVSSEPDVPNNHSRAAATASSEMSQMTSSRRVPKSSKRERSKSAKTNRRLKSTQNRETAKPTTSAQPLLLEKSNCYSKTLPAEPECDISSKNYEPPLLEKSSSALQQPHGSVQMSLSNARTTVQYAVTNSVDIAGDTNTVVGLAKTGEQKTLRISLVAVNDASESNHRVKDTRTENICNASKVVSCSTVAPVYTTTVTTSAVNNVKHLMSGCHTVSDTDLPESSVENIMSQEALEHDSSTLLSQCKSLSVVIEKMRNRSYMLPATPEPKPTCKRQKAMFRHRCVDRPRKPAVSNNLSSSAVEKPAEESVTTAAVNDEYNFCDDAASDGLLLPQALRPERRGVSRKGRNSLLGSDQVDTSPAAASDSSSRGAGSSVDSSVISGNSGVHSLTSSSVPKRVSKSVASGGRSRRRRQNFQEDEDTRSLSPFTPNGNSPAPVVEASLDGHKLKLRITKFSNRSVETQSCDTKVSVPPSPGHESADSITKLKENEVPSVAEHEIPRAVEVCSEPVSRRRRNLKVEGVRSRFLTLHKPSGMVPSADQTVKCRLVKVGRRQWMSVGGDEPDDDSSTAQHSDTEKPTENSPAASSFEHMVQQPTRDRLLLVTEKKKRGRRGRPPKAKTDSAQENSLPSSSKRTKKRTKAAPSHLEISSPKPDAPPEVVSRPVREDPVPWLDIEADGTASQLLCSLGSSSLWNVASDIEERQLHVSTPAELLPSIDLSVCDALSDCAIELNCSTVLMPRSTFFVPSELEQLMAALVLDDLCRQTCTHSPPTTKAAETCILPAVSVDRTFSYCNSVSSPVLSLRDYGEMDLLLSQESLRQWNCVLPTDANDRSDYDCTVVGYEYPARCLPDSVELPLLVDHQLVDDDYSLPSACLTDRQLYSSVDFVL